MPLTENREIRRKYSHRLRGNPDSMVCPACKYRTQCIAKPAVGIDKWDGICAVCGNVLLSDVTTNQPDVENGKVLSLKYITFAHF